MELKKHTLEYYDYFEMRDHIKTKYGIEERDYRKTHSAYNEAKAVADKAFPDAGDWFKILPSEYTPTQKEAQALYLVTYTALEAERPYCDYWHFLLDYFGEFSKGTPTHLNWGDVMQFADEDWQKEITQLYIDEFGEKDYTVIIDW